MKLTKNKTNRH